MSDEADVLRRELECCVSALFEAYDIEAKVLARPSPTKPDLAGEIGFVSDALSGSLLVAAPIEAVLGTGLVDGYSGSVEDALGELTNQVLGRLKNRLLRYNNVIQVGTPKTTEAVSPRRRGKGQRILQMWFHTRSGDFHVALAVEVKPHFRMVLSSKIPEVMPEGDCALF